MVIYKTTNKINGKIYVGKDSKDKFNYYGSGLILKRAIKKYGIKNFEKEILQECSSQKELNEAEKYWIQKENSLVPNGYNIAFGGAGGDTISKNPNKNLISKKISEGKKQSDYFHSEATKKQISKKHLGKTLPEATKIAISKTLKEKYKSGEIISIGMANEKNPMYKVSMIERIINKHGETKGRIKFLQWKEKQSQNTKGENNPMYKKHFTTIWKEKYGEELANIMIKETYSKVGKSVKETKKIKK